MSRPLPDLRFPFSLDHETFLREYWQKRPLLMPGALTEFHCPLSPQELAGLSCEDYVESRIVIERDAEDAWHVHHGPFDERYFATLPERGWTLLVQDVDKHVPQLFDLLDYFSFLPDWRIDDVMVSFACDRGSVGPHVDDYDVFLFQALGRRHWQIHTRPVSEDDYIPGLELRILRTFDAQRQWTLEPGDMLYLPPRVAHWGIAMGDCMTCSVGFRAPALHELLTSRCEDIIARGAPEERYSDGDLRSQGARAEIRPEVLDDVLELLRRHGERDRDAEMRWFGRLVTESKAHLAVHPRLETLSSGVLHDRFGRQGFLNRNPYSRLAFIRGTLQNDYLFANGACYQLASNLGDFLPAITQNHSLSFGMLERWLADAECLRLLCRLYNDGHFEFTES